MSLFSDVSQLGSSMRAFSYGLNVTANNVANANTVGYSREVLDLQAGTPYQEDGIWLGTGVNATSVQRVRDLFLDSQIKTQDSQLGYANAQSEALNQLAAIFPEVANASATTGLTGAIDNVASAWTALAAAPSSIAAKTTVINSLDAVAQMLQVDERGVFSLQTKLDGEIQTTVSQINTLTDQIASLNAQIKVSGGNSAPGTLLDAREQAAEQLSQLIGAQFVTLGDGTMSVNINNGALVTENQSFHLADISSSTFPGQTSIGYYASATGTPTDVTAQIQSGQLGGLLQVRNGEVATARLNLNQIAYGIISSSNLVNETYTAADGTTNHDLMQGTSAADIHVNSLVEATPDYVGGTRDASDPGDLALMQSQIKNFIQFSYMISADGSPIGGGFNVNPTTAIGSQFFAIGPSASATPASPGEMDIATNGNAIQVFWNVTQSINTIIKNINTAGAGAFYATFNPTTQQFILTGDTPLSVYDVTGNLADVLQISAKVTSSAPINSYSTSGLNQVADFAPLNSATNLLDLYTKADAGGSILVNGQTVNWNPSQAPATTIAGNIQAATGTVGLSPDPNPTQTYILEDARTTSGSHTFGNPVTGIQVADVTGNLTRVLNLDTDTNASQILSQLISGISAQQSSATVAATQAQALVSNTQQLQNNVSQVNTDQETAQAEAYQRSYEAAIRIQSVINEMLDTLINRMGSEAPNPIPV
jgi:flagellar hook-associated protein 1